MSINRTTQVDEGELKTCVDCNRDFLFPTSEKEWLIRKGLHPRRRCRDCVEAKKTHWTNGAH